MVKWLFVCTLVSALVLSSVPVIRAADDDLSDRVDQLENELKELKAELKEKGEAIKAQDLRIDQEVRAIAQQKGELAAIKIKYPSGIQENKYVFGEYWDDGLFLETPNKEFNVRIGGSINLDARWPNTSSKLQDYLETTQGKGLHESSEVRRARMFMKGTMYTNIFYKMQIDFADTAGTYYIHDMFVGLMDIPYVGAVLIGHAARAWGLNPVPDENWLTFMEWAPPFGFGIGQLIGVAAGNSYLDNHFTYAIQVGKTGGIHCSEIGQSYNMNLRFTGTPWYEDGGYSMLHQGVSYTYRGSSDETRFVGGPSFSEQVPQFIDTGTLDTARVNGINYSAALCQGPLRLQGEYYGMWADQKDGPSSTFFQGWYGMVSYYLTGEPAGAQYVTSYGGFDIRCHPLENFNMKEGTWGAFEVAARYSGMDLNDENIRGGVLNQGTLGVNWYLNPNFRWMVNYVHSHVNGVGSADIIETRFGIDF